MGSHKKQELLGIKLKNGILISKANKTTPSPSWKSGFHNHNNSSSSSLHPNFSMHTCVSARKIGANLWEVQPQFNFNKNDVDHEPSNSANHDHGDPIHRRRRRQRSYENEGLPVSDQLHQHPSNSDSNPIQQEMESSLRRNIVELRRHLSVDQHSQELRHTSSASCYSSMQVTPYASGYTLNTSMHLLKVLNRIWNLEEQHSRNRALIKSLKRDVEISQAQIKTLVEERRMAHQEIDELKRSTHERKQKAVRSTEDEKSLFMREKKARILLESLCDEFAKGVRDYEQKLRLLQQNQTFVSVKEPDRLILDVSEAWLDERAQMKYDLSSISDNLCCEIEMFLEAKKKQSSDLMSKRAPHGATEPSPKEMIEQGPGATEASSRRGREGGTLMAKLVEARLESQFLKATSVRKKKVV